MRATLTLLMVLAAPLVAAAASVAVEDPAFDEALLPPLRGQWVDWDGVAECHDPAVDLTALRAEHDGDLLTITAQLLDLGATPACRGVPLTREMARYSAYLNEAGAEGSTVFMRASEGGTNPCVEIDLGTQFSECLREATFRVSGSSLAWSFPLHGTTAPRCCPNDLRPYDLRGVEYSVFVSAVAGFPGVAGTWSRVGAGFGPLRLVDDAPLLELPAD